MTRWAWQQVLDTFLPQVCPGCGEYLPRGSGLSFCAKCYADLPWWNPSQLLPPKLGRAIDSFQAPLLYAEPFRRVLLAFKFADGTHLAPLLARLLLPYMLVGPDVVVVPVPLHPSRLRSRMYNHAALLAKAVAKLAGLPCDVLSLTRTRKGSPQHDLTRAGRLRLTSGSFACLPTMQGKTVILIDDIFTTGATAASCAQTLKKAGAKAVHVRTLAYTQPG